MRTYLYFSKKLVLFWNADNKKAYLFICLFGSIMFLIIYDESVEQRTSGP